MKILGIESSCDETAVAVVEDGKQVLSSCVATSLDLHAPFGGVIPEIAARSHVEVIDRVAQDALTQAGIGLSGIDGIAVTYGPGLPGALLVGLSFAKGLALSLQRPLIPVNHLAAHLYAAQMTDSTCEPPYVGLLVSGGHTLLCVVESATRFSILGETRDDAVGEAFDKVSRLMGLGYPGGPVIDRLAKEGIADATLFPRCQTKQALDFSYSGLKTAVYQYLKRDASYDKARVAASFQDTAISMLVSRSLKALKRTGYSTLVVGGGVALNSLLRKQLCEAAQKQGYHVVFAKPELCSDNAAMIAGIGYELLKEGRVAPLSLAIEPNLVLGQEVW